MRQKNTSCFKCGRAIHRKGKGDIMPRPKSPPKLKPNKRDGIYQIHYTDEQGRKRQQSTGERTYEDAYPKWIEFCQKQPASEGPSDPSEVTVMEVCEPYSLERGPHMVEASHVRVNYAIKAMAEPLGNLPLSKLTPALLMDFAKNRGVEPSTIIRELKVLTSAINHAYNNKRLLHKVPVWMPDKPEGRKRWLTRNEAARLLWAVRHDEHLKLFILICIYGGGRKVATLELRWPQIKFEEGIVDFKKPGEKKTNKGKPTNHVPAKLMWWLRKAYERRESDLGYVITYRGKQIKNNRKAFAKAVKRAGLETSGPDKVTPHTCKHTCGTWMARNGAPMALIAKYLAHSIERTTELYIHLAPDDTKKAAGYL
jgi:integrase